MADEGTSTGILPAAAEAAAVEAVVVVGQQFAAAQAVNLTITRYDVLTFMDVDLYRVADPNGTMVFKVNRVLFNSRRILLNAAGNVLLTIKPDHSDGFRGFELRDPWKVYKGHSCSPNDLLFTLKRCSLFECDKYKVILAPNEAATCDFMINGNGRNARCTISIGQSNTIIAQDLSQMQCERALLRPSKPIVTVNSNVDHVFIVSLIIILEEIRRSSRGR
ncbi:hypothetical protein ZIOFF_072594 [Zingiber officinale]|uniref:Uncharacterized protein n=1 Tax=Zingiber officinale TaxID=94328 RepID=A0A8J5ELW2_ZINOF|nr:hypothetical protein ZIOFF_072594 [Zingiber officinale]